MSHISKILLKFSNLEALEQSCINLGAEFRWNQQTYAWWGKYLGDSKLPDGVKVEDLGKCTHAIHVPGAKYEVGVIDNKDGTYSLFYDYWSGGYGLEAKIGKQACLLTAEYGAVCAENEFRDNGYDCHREIDEEGFIVVEGTKLVEY